MAERVVDVLIPIEIDQQDAERVAVLAAALDFLLEPRAEQLTVGETGQIVSCRQPVQLLGSLA